MLLGVLKNIVLTTALYVNNQTQIIFPETAHKLCICIMPSINGNMGPGVYLTTLVEAIKISDFKAYDFDSGYEGAVVIIVAVNLGKLKQCSDLEPCPYFDIEEFNQQKFDSATSIHERWAGIDYPFRQWVVKNSEKLRVTDVWIMNGDL
eukprot:403359174